MQLLDTLVCTCTHVCLHVSGDNSPWVSHESASLRSRCTACLGSNVNSLRRLICLPWLTASYTDSGALTQGGVPLLVMEDELRRCHRMFFLLPVGTGTQGTEKKAATLGSAIDVRNKLSHL